MCGKHWDVMADVAGVLADLRYSLYATQADGTVFAQSIEQRWSMYELRMNIETVHRSSRGISVQGLRDNPFLGQEVSDMSGGRDDRGLGADVLQFVCGGSQAVRGEEERDPGRDRDTRGCHDEAEGVFVDLDRGQLRACVCPAPGL